MSKLSLREYNYIHQWNLRHWTKSGICEHCHEAKKTQWSNKTGEYRLGDKTDWQELCIKCHASYDRQGKRCIYCRQRKLTVRVYKTHTDWYQNGNPKYKRIALCPECIEFELSTEDYYLGRTDKLPA